MKIRFLIILCFLTSTGHALAETSRFKLANPAGTAAISSDLNKNGDSLLQAFKDKAGDVIVVGSSKVDYGFKCFISAVINGKQTRKTYFIPDSGTTYGLACDDVDAVGFMYKKKPIIDILISAKSYQQNRPEDVFRSFYVMTLNTHSASLYENKSCNELIYSQDSQYWKIYKSGNAPGITWLEAYLQGSSPRGKACR